MYRLRLFNINSYMFGHWYPSVAAFWKKKNTLTRVIMTSTVLYRTFRITAFFETTATNWKNILSQLSLNHFNTLHWLNGEVNHYPSPRTFFRFLGACKKDGEKQIWKSKRKQIPYRCIRKKKSNIFLAVRSAIMQLIKLGKLTLQTTGIT